LFPKVLDYHKPNKPLVPNGLGVLYVLTSAAYLFLLDYLGVVKTSHDVSLALTLAVCILFGGFMGLLDDWMDLRWRYKAFFPLIAVIPLVTLATRLGLRTSMTLPFLGSIHFDPVVYYFIVLPLFVTIATNTVNMLGGLNGLETVCPSIVLIGLMILAGPNAVLLYVPLIMWLVLAFLNFQGKLFVGNTGSFAIGITLASFATISDLKVSLIISLSPYILNSMLILLTYFVWRSKASISFAEGKLSSEHRRSLVTLVTYRHHLTERQVVVIMSLLFVASTSVALILQTL